MTTTKTYNQTIVLIIGAIVSLLLLVPLSAEAATGTIKGYIFDDDSGFPWVNDTSTDADGTWQQNLGEGVLDWVNVWAIDSTGVPKFIPTNNAGVFTLNVEAGENILLFIEPHDNNLPSRYAPTTPLTQLIDVGAGETVWADHFGYGPQY